MSSYVYIVTWKTCLTSVKLEINKWLTEALPADSPKIVTWSLSPPKRCMYFSAHLNPITWSRIPILPIAFSESRHIKPKTYFRYFWSNLINVTFIPICALFYTWYNIETTYQGLLFCSWQLLKSHRLHLQFFPFHKDYSNPNRKRRHTPKTSLEAF